VEEAFNKTSDL